MFNLVPEPERPEPREVQRLFDGLAAGYDRFNAIASLGLDRIWRRSLVKELLAACPQGVVLDAGCGTGDLIFDLQSRSDAGAHQFVGVDLSIPMMEAAKRKVKSPSLFIQASCEALPLASESADGVVSAFVLRNVRKIMPEVLAEFLRVMKRGSRAFLLEMTVPGAFWLRIPHKIYLKSVLPLVGRSLFGARWSGDYLKDTILQFWPPEEFSQILRQAGFREVSYESLTGGLAVLYRCKK